MAYQIIEPAVDPVNRISFLMDWEVTLKCNLDCDYCLTDLYGGHDNSTKHPPLDECLKTIDFLYAYTDLYMSSKIKGIRYGILNVYGGESLHHPNIVEILKECHVRYKKYEPNWKLTITTTTNGIISNKKFDKIIPYIDEFTFSYHSQNTDKQKEQFKRNILAAKNSNVRVKCVVLKHPKFFEDTKQFILWCEENQVPFLARQLDHPPHWENLHYDGKQVIWFEKLYKSKGTLDGDLTVHNVNNKFDLADTGRACCGGRSLCTNGDYKDKKFFITGNNFKGWHCSVNEFFVYAKQVNGEVYTSKDCKMNFDGTVSPIGSLKDTAKILEFTKNNLDNNTLPVIVCNKERCKCGLCAPKAVKLDDFNKIMKKYRKT